jgi:hypothetical protein
VNILRDAAQLQAQLRIYDGLVETRHTLLKLRPTLRQHWIALAVAYHLNGNLPAAKKVLDQYERIIKVQVSWARRSRLLTRIFRISQITTSITPNIFSIMSVY